MLDLAIIVLIALLTVAAAASFIWTAYDEWRERRTTAVIVIDPKVMGGAPCIKDTHISVYLVFTCVKDGTIEELMRTYPSVSRASFDAAIDYAKRYPRTKRAR